MSERLFVGVLGNQNSGKSSTWNALFEKTVRTGTQSRILKLRKNECVEVFLVSGSNEERKKYAGDVLKNQSSRIILCSMQYIEHVSDTLSYIKENNFSIYVQWLNPGYHDGSQYFDYLGMSGRLLGMGATISIRSGKTALESRVDELREFIYGWASFRDLIVAC